jgi:hypothetical protein
VSDIKKDIQVKDFLHHHSIQLTNHEWLEKDWDTKTIGFFTQVFPSAMTNEYASKVVSKRFNRAASRHLVPQFRIHSIPMRVTDSNQGTTL